jgi:hypothetical protein
MRLLLLLACTVSDAARLLAPIADSSEAVVLPDTLQIVQPVIDQLQVIDASGIDKYVALIESLGTASDRLREELARLWTCDPDSAVQRSVWWTAKRSGKNLLCPGAMFERMIDSFKRADNVGLKMIAQNALGRKNSSKDSPKWLPEHSLDVLGESEALRDLLRERLGKMPADDVHRIVAGESEIPWVAKDRQALAEWNSEWGEQYRTRPIDVAFGTMLRDSALLTILGHVLLQFTKVAVSGIAKSVARSPNAQPPQADPEEASEVLTKLTKEHMAASTNLQKVSRRLGIGRGVFEDLKPVGHKADVAPAAAGAASSEWPIAGIVAMVVLVLTLPLASVVFVIRAPLSWFDGAAAGPKRPSSKDAQGERGKAKATGGRRDHRRALEERAIGT